MSDHECTTVKELKKYLAPIMDDVKVSGKITVMIPEAVPTGGVKKKRVGLKGHPAKIGRGNE